MGYHINPFRASTRVHERQYANEIFVPYDDDVMQNSGFVLSVRPSRWTQTQRSLRNVSLMYLKKIKRYRKVIKNKVITDRQATVIVT